MKEGKRDYFKTICSSVMPEIGLFSVGLNSFK